MDFHGQAAGMKTIPENEEINSNSIGRNWGGRPLHRRTKSTGLFLHNDLNGLFTHNEAVTTDTSTATTTSTSGNNTSHRRARSHSWFEAPSAIKFYPGSHLLDDFPETRQYLSFWLLPPEPTRKKLSKEITKLSLRYSDLGSSVPFEPHVTIIGSIPCETAKDARAIGERLQRGLKNTGAVPCRFHNQPCVPMYNEKQHLVWSQACIAIMERSEEFMELLAKSREILGMGMGEWMFPPPAREPHLSYYYGYSSIPKSINPPSEFVAVQAALWMTTPGTVEGVAGWREVTRINLVPSSDM